MAARPVPQQNQPLPPGYEARWDPGQNAYFFINHYTKTTTWTDPRLSQHAGAKQALNQPEPSKPQEREAIPLSDIRHTDRGGTAYHHKKKETPFIHADSVHVNKLRNMFPDCSVDLIKSTLVKYHNNFEVTKSTLINNGYRCLASGAVSVNDDSVTRLQRKFPEASHLIPDVLTACGNNENDAARQLKDLGFGQDRHRSPSPKPQSHRPLNPSASATASSPSGRHASPRRAASPVRQPSPVRQQDPEPVRVSEAEKERLKRKLNAEFSHIGDYLVNMALEACEYNEDSTRAVLDTGIEDVRGKSSRPSTTESTRPSTSHSTASTASTSRIITSPVPLATNDLEPVAFTMDDDNMPMKPGSATSRETTQSERSPVKKQQQKAKHVTKIRTPKPGPVVSQPRSRTNVAPKPARSVVTKRQTGQVYESIYRTPPMGPDPTLRSGPDPSLRGVREQLANGPDPSLRQGPDPERRMGSQGWNGPDPSLRCGPMKVVANNRVLVSSI
ncbi:hypothetical protein SNE40_001221 [Patella caerulea]|uniref:WW domain-containing protein n=1 Tax=Patella caerulea TaxID=87958 RepID=A0AAN8K6R3_PATCE